MLSEPLTTEVGQLQTALGRLPGPSAKAEVPLPSPRRPSPRGRPQLKLSPRGPAPNPRPPCALRGIDAEAYVSSPFLRENSDLANHILRETSEADMDRAQFFEVDMFEQESSGEESAWDYGLCNSGTAPIQKEPPVTVPRLRPLRKIGGRCPPGYRAPPPTSRDGCDWGFGWLCLPQKLDGVVDLDDGVKAKGSKVSKGRREDNRSCGVTSLKLNPPPSKQAANDPSRRSCRQCETICDDDGS